MKHDEELQRRIENGESVDDSPDSRAYRKVFDTLKREPYLLPTDFAEKIVYHIEKRNNGLSNDYFWFGLGLLAFIGAAIFAVSRTDFRINFGALKFISGYSGFLIFGLAFILLIQYLDKQFISGRPNLKIRSGTIQRTNY